MRKIVACATALMMFLSFNIVSVSALPSAQLPHVEATILVESDGTEPLDSTTWDGTTDQGMDSSLNNGVVRSMDSISYKVEISLNGASDTNVYFSVALNQHAFFPSVPEFCLSESLETSAVLEPVSGIIDTNDDGNSDTLVCNIGSMSEGSKVSYSLDVRAAGSNGDVVSATVLGDSDNNVNTGGLGTTQGFGSPETAITSSFNVLLDKTVYSLSEANETRFWSIPVEASASPNGEAGYATSWTFKLLAPKATERIADNGDGLQSFVFRDSWSVNHLTQGAVGNSITLFPGETVDGCVNWNPEVVGSVTCTQPGGPGTDVIIEVNDYDVFGEIEITDGSNDFGVEAQYFEIGVDLFVPVSDIDYDPGVGEVLDVINSVSLNSWGPTGVENTGNLISQSGASNLTSLSASADFPVAENAPGGTSWTKTFDGYQSAGDFQKSGQVLGSEGETITASLSIADNSLRESITHRGICETLDVDVFEFAGAADDGTQKSVYWDKFGDATVFPTTATLPLIDYWATPWYTFESYNKAHELPGYNPLVWAYTNWGNTPETLRVGAYTGDEAGITVEYSDISYADTGDDHWTATCEDDMDGDGSYDWVLDPSTLAGGESSVSRVRLLWERNLGDLGSQIGNSRLNRIRAIFSYDLVIKSGIDTSNTDYLANTATRTADYTVDATQGWIPPLSDGGGYVVDDDPAAVYSFNVRTADRVRLVGAYYNIRQFLSDDSNYNVAQGEETSFTIKPQFGGNFSAGTAITITDQFDNAMDYVSDTCAEVMPDCSVVVDELAKTVIFNIPNVRSSSDLADFELTVRNNGLTPSYTYPRLWNRVEITSDQASINDVVPLADTYGWRSISLTDSAGFKVSKLNLDDYVEPGDDFNTTLVYSDEGSDPVGVGQIIDVLPYNGDGDPDSQTPSSPERFNQDLPSNQNTETVTSDPGGRAVFVAISPSVAGETFEYSTDVSSSISHRPCHPSNWPVGATVTPGGAEPIDLICSQGLLEPTTGLPTLSQVGTGTTTWLTSVPSDLSSVTAVRVSTPAFTEGETEREITLTLNSGDSADGNLLCNNFGANAALVTLDVISNDVCVGVVAGSIGDSVWLDVDENGIKGPSERGLEGVTLELLDEASQPILDSYGNAMRAVTDSSGEYLFENLKSGRYLVRIVESSLPGGLVATFDSDGGLDLVSASSLSGPASDPSLAEVSKDFNQDFGFTSPYDLALIKSLGSVPSEGVSPGDSITYLLKVFNQGSADVTEVKLVDFIPDGLVLDDTSWIETDDGAIELIQPVASIAAGQSIAIEISFKVRAGASGEVVNLAEIASFKGVNGESVVDLDSFADTLPGNDGEIIDDAIDGTDGDEDDSDIAIIEILSQTNFTDSGDPDSPEVIAFTGASTVWMLGAGVLAIIAGLVIRRRSDRIMEV